MQSHVASAPTLDQTVEPWLGTFPGLGRITVAADGAVQVEPDTSGDEDNILREQALRYGWAESLSWVRRDFTLAGGAAVATPGDSAPKSIVLTGDPHDVVIVIAALVSRSWAVMGDRFTPVRWEGAQLIAYPRDAPILMARRRATKLGMEGTPVRGDTDALRVDFPRHTAPTPVCAVVHVAMRRPHEGTLEPLAGQQRFEAAANLMLGGVLAKTWNIDPDDEAAVAQARAETLSEHLRLAGLSYCRLRIDSSNITDDITTFAEWLASIGIVDLAGPPAPTVTETPAGTA